MIYVKHFTAAGIPFWAIYGHCNLENDIYPRPAGTLPTAIENYPGGPIDVTKGRRIGSVIFPGEPHLHLGIHERENWSDPLDTPAGYGWGRVPTTASPDYIKDTLKWRPPIDQDSPPLLGFLNEPANSNNEPEQFSNWQTRSFAGTTVDPAQQLPDADADGDGILNRDEYGLSLNPLSGADEGRPKVELITSGAFRSRDSSTSAGETRLI